MAATTKSVHASPRIPRIEAQPIVGQRGHLMQAYGTLARSTLGLADRTRAASVECLKQLLADTITLRDT